MTNNGHHVTEKQLRHAFSFFDLLPVAMVVASLDGRLFAFNQHLPAMTQYREKELQDADAKMFYANPSDRTKLIDALENNDRPVGFLCEWKRKDGSTFPGHITCNYIIMDGRKMILGAIEDFTRQKAVENEMRKSNANLFETLEELKNAQQQLIHHERLSALGQMASGIAHDFNNLLMPIMGFSEFLINNPDIMNNRSESLEMLNSIFEAATEAREVIRRLRNFYSPSSNEEKSAVNIREEVDSVIAMTRPKWKEDAGRSGVTIEIETDIRNPAPAHVNRAQLGEILTNLIFNAVEAMPQGGTLLIEAKDCEQGNLVELSVADQGKGMDAEVLKRCQEPFFTTKNGHGAGLGLSTVHGLMLENNGTIKIESTPDKGTRVTLLFNAAVDQAEPAPVPAAPETCEGKKILFVDDEQSARDIVKRYLEAEKHIVDVADSGKIGLDMFNSGSYDMVITDCAMPGMNGEQLADAIKESSPDVPVIMLTGFGAIMDKEECTESIDMIIAKPISQKELSSAVASMAVTG